MIPKKIHFIWLGGNKKPNAVNMCILSWHNVLSDYEIIEWNEENLKLDQLCKKNRFLRECRKRKLWAYMADYLRLHILYEEGGIYFDTDIQVLKSFNDLLHQSCFFGYEVYNYVGTGVIGCEKNNPVIKKILDFYNEDIWNSSAYTIPMIVTKVLKNVDSKSYHIYPMAYFAPYDYDKPFTMNLITQDTRSVHWFANSWEKNINVYTFLMLKHIKNPMKKRSIIIQRYIKYSIQRVIRFIRSW